MAITDIPTSFSSSFIIKTFFPGFIATVLYSFALTPSWTKGLEREDLLITWIVLGIVVGLIINSIDTYIYQFFEGINWPKPIRQWKYQRILKYFEKIDKELKENNDKLEKKLKFEELRNNQRKLWSEVRKFPYKSDKLYLFSWDEIPGSDNGSLIELLIRDFNIKWVKRAKISKGNDGESINIINEKNFFSLRFARLIKFLIKNLDVKWVRGAKINTSDDGKTIALVCENNYFFSSLSSILNRLKESLIRDFNVRWVRRIKIKKNDNVRTISFIYENNALSLRLCNEYMFCWEEVPGNDSGRFIEFLIQIFDVNWVREAKIDKINGGITIKVYSENNSLSLRLNNEKTKAILIIDDAKTYKFIVKTENGKLNIYNKIILTINDDIKDEFNVETIIAQYPENSKLNIYKEFFSKRYPEQATIFGNVLSEYENYSENQYGMHMMVFWQHLWFILPKELKEDIDLRTAHVDFIVYLSFIFLSYSFIGGIGFYFQKITLGNILTHNIPYDPPFGAIISFISIALCFFFYKVSISNQRGYGRYIKAIFDLYRFDLEKKLNIDDVYIPDDKEIKKWGKYRNFLLDYEKK